MAPQFPFGTKSFIMDKKLIEQYGEDILSYRLRTARQKKRMQYEDFDKQLLKLYREERALYQQERDLGWEPLLPPVQKGWKRFFVLRDDVARSKQAEFYENILQKINTTLLSYRKDFMKKKRKFGRKIYVVKEQYLYRPYDWEFSRMGFTAAEMQLFDMVHNYDKGGRLYTRYVFRQPWRFVLRVKPHMIDKVRKIESLEIEARQKAIHDYVNWNGYKGRKIKVVDGYNPWRPDPQKEEPYAYKNKSLSQILDLIND